MFGDKKKVAKLPKSAKLFWTPSCITVFNNVWRSREKKQGDYTLSIKKNKIKNSQCLHRSPVSGKVFAPFSSLAEPLSFFFFSLLLFTHTTL